MNWLSKRYDHLVFEEYRTSVHFLSVFRILFCLAIIVVTGLRDSAWMSESSNYLFTPPFSVAIFFDHIPALGWLVALDLLTWASLLFLLFGYKTTYASIALTFFLVLQGSFLYSLGKVDHDILYVLVPLGLAFSKWGKMYSIDALSNDPGRDYSRESQGWPVAVVSLFLCFGMFTSGFQKLLGGWLTLDSPAIHAHVVKNFFVGRRTDFLAEAGLHLNNVTLWELGDWMTVVFEMGFLIAFFNRRILRFFLLGAVFFHLANFLLLNIIYETNFLVYMLFVPAALFSFGTANGQRFLRWFSSTKALVATMVGIGFTYGVFQLIGDTELRAFPSVTNLIGYLTDSSGRYVTAYAVILITTFVLIRAASQSLRSSGRLREASVEPLS